MMVLVFCMVMLPCSTAGDEHQGNAQYKQQDRGIIFHFQREQKVRYRERKKMLFVAETWKPNLARLSEMAFVIVNRLTARKQFNAAKNFGWWKGICTRSCNSSVV